MAHGYALKMLHIDLSGRFFREIPIEPDTVKTYLGGRGLGARLYYDLIPPETDPLGPDNLFMVLTGPLTATMAPGAGKHLIITKSPATGGWLESYSSGYFAVELKFCGYDALIISGRSASPVCLFIRDRQVDFEDARPLWGKDSFAAERYVKSRLGEKAGVLSIGQAGENRVRFACVGSEYFRKAGRGGAGAVLGSKQVKAIGVKGSGGVTCTDLPGMFALVKKHHERHVESPVGKARRRYGTPLTFNITNAAGMLPTKNFQGGTDPEAVGKIDADGMSKRFVRDRACYSCIMACSKWSRAEPGSRFPGVQIEGPEYETIGMFGSNLGIHDPSFIIAANKACDRLGLDTISSGSVVGYVMECFEKGYLTEADTGGLRLGFGDIENVLRLLEQIARREGFGALCAEGVKGLADRLPPAAGAFAMHAKGLEFPAYDPRAGWGAALTYAVTPRGGCHRRAWPPMKEVLGDLDPFTTENKARIVKEMMDENCVMHSLIVCDIGGKFIPLSTGDYTEYLNAVTGESYRSSELLWTSGKVETMIRLINLREGLGKESDALPARVLKECHARGPTKDRVMGEENFKIMRTEYYGLRGWDEDGVPEPATLAKYRIEDDAGIVLDHRAER
ncbi:MAG: aldehyde ferredoxin oxidoreductase [Desulfobacteraceae bacterium]|nr:MAG: aldehyde ferredoxin oxidoreductase [Desulfobacteraceae bacterium]